MIYAIIILISLAGFTKALLDYSAIDGFNNSWWNKTYSWKNKWKLKYGEVIENKKRLPYYLWLYKPNYVEKYPNSSTILVSLTDGWHLLQKILYSFIFLAISLSISQNLEYTRDVIEVVCSFIILSLVFTITFEILYKKITTNENS